MAYTHLNPGVELELSERAYFSNTTSDISTLVTLSPEELKQMELSSVDQEKATYSSLLDIVATWKQQAQQTLALRKAQEYLRLPATQHTSNQWHDEGHDWRTMSNMVYKFTYQIYERTKWDKELQKSVPVAWELSWYLVFNTPNNPDYSGSGRQIAGQSHKVFKDTASMHKYLQGRIAAYAHLFTEISPPIPEADRRRFCVNGVLLPGYTVENPDAMKPDEAAVDKLLALVSDDELSGGAALQPKPPQEIWAQHRKQRPGPGKRKTAPTR